MADTKQIKSAAERRERKVTAQQVASAQAVADLAVIHDLPKDTAAREQHIAKVAAAKPVPMTRKERKLQAKKQAEEQAQRDAIRMSRNTSFEVLEQYVGKPGEVPPLHIQNALQAAAALDMKDEARDVANAAGKAAYDVVLGKTPRNQHTRQKRIAQMQIHAREQSELKAASVKS